MGRTTLITFFLQTPRTVQSVQLRGSWDNFSHAYPMERDARRGRGHWRGCHAFKDIICDGDTEQCLPCKRDGGLLEGGRYWYYYQIDDDVEMHDQTEPSTTNCPFLPGQEVNVLEVPVQYRSRESSHERSSSTSSSTRYTLDPQDKFRTPVPPYAALHEQSLSYQRPATRSGSRPVTALGAGDDVNQLISTALSFTGRSTALETLSICSEPPIPVSDSMFYGILARPYTTAACGIADYPNLSTEVWDRSQTSWLDLPFATDEGTPQLTGTLPEAIPSNDSSSYMDLNQVTDRMAASSLQATRSPMTQPATSGRATPMPQDAGVPPEGLKLVCSVQHSNSTSSAYTCSLQPTSSVSSARTSGMWSSLTSGSGALEASRAARRSQPLTPTISMAGDWGLQASTDSSLEPSETEPQHLDMSSSASKDCFHIGGRPRGYQSANSQARLPDVDYEVPNTVLHRTDSGFLGYSLPEAEYSSALTIRNLETATSGGETRPRKQYIEAWNDGHGTALQELVDDLGYLGSMIA